MRHDVDKVRATSESSETETVQIRLQASGWALAGASMVSESFGKGKSEVTDVTRRMAPDANKISFNLLPIIIFSFDID